MFSYIYADQITGLLSFQVAKSLDAINAMALTYIKNVLSNQAKVDNSLNQSKINAIDAALDGKDIEKSMRLWDEYSTTILHNTVIHHKISMIDMTE